jgi:hypothetical protein
MRHSWSFPLTRTIQPCYWTPRTTIWKLSSHAIADKLCPPSHSLIICNFNSKLIRVRLWYGLLFPSCARLPPAMVKNIKTTAKNVKISTTVYHRDVYTARHTRTGKMQLPAFTGCINLHITYFRCFALALSVNILYLGYFLHKYGFTHVGFT